MTKIFPRQRQILDLYWTGLSQKEVAHAMGIGEACVIDQFATIKRRFKAKHLVHLYRLVLREKQIKP